MTDTRSILDLGGAECVAVKLEPGAALPPGAEYGSDGVAYIGLPLPLGFRMTDLGVIYDETEIGSGCDDIPPSQSVDRRMLRRLCTDALPADEASATEDALLAIFDGLAAGDLVQIGVSNGTYVLNPEVDPDGFEGDQVEAVDMGRGSREQSFGGARDVVLMRPEIGADAPGTYEPEPSDPVLLRGRERFVLRFCLRTVLGEPFGDPDATEGQHAPPHPSEILDLISQLADEE